MQNRAIKTIGVCEFITGGGLVAQDLPPSLVKEGTLMRDALLRDLSELSYRVISTLDARIKPPAFGDYVTVQTNDDVWTIWQAQFSQADMLFIIAPETGGVLLELTQMAEKNLKTDTVEAALVLGCRASAVALASDKMATFLALQAAGIATIPTYTFETWPAGAGAWLTKPNDGAGCSDTVCFESAQALRAWIVENGCQDSHIIQPFYSGVPASISCVMHNGQAQLLSCNRQEMILQAHVLQYQGSIVNGMRTHWQQFADCAQQIAQLMPDLNAYVGIDVLVNGYDVCVVEINPRLTTSYVGLRAATGINPAELIINTLTQPNYVWPQLQQQEIRIDV